MTQILTGTGRFIGDPTIKCAVGIVDVKGKRTVAWSVHEGELGPRIYPLSRSDALALSDALARAAAMVDHT